MGMDEPITKGAIFCNCHSSEHQLVLTYVPGDTHDEPDEVFIEVHLRTSDNFFKRIVTAIRYIFGYKSRFGAWDEFTVKYEDCDTLIDHFTRMKKSYEKNKITWGVTDFPPTSISGTNITNMRPGDTATNK